MCVFFKEIVPNRGALAWYADAVVREIELYRASSAVPGSRLKSIYFGGGTATLLEPDGIKRIISAISSLFPSGGPVEVTLEGHPATVCRDYLLAVKEAGVNRVSLGVQSFDPRHLSVLRMRQTPEINQKAIEDAVGAGFETVSVDIMYRLPGQTTRAVLQDVEAAWQLGVTSISTYSFAPSEQQAGLSPQQPTEAEDREMFYAILDVMSSRGWTHVAQPDYSAPRHETQELGVSWRAPQGQNLSLGAGGWSVFAGAVYCNVHDLSEYRRVVEAGALPILAGTHMTVADAITRFPVLGVRCFEVPNDSFASAFGADLIDAFAEQIEELGSLGLVERMGKDLHVTRLGKYYVDNVSKAFYSTPNRRRSQPWGLFYRGARASRYLRPEDGGWV